MIRKKYLYLGISGILVFCSSIAGSFWIGYKNGVQDGKTEIINSQIIPKGDSNAQLDVPIDNFLKGIIQLEGESPSPAFQESVDKVYKNIVLKVADQYDFSEVETQEVLNKYSLHRESIVRENFDALKAMSLERQSVPSSSFIEFEHRAVADDFNALLLKNSCSTVNSIIGISKLKFGRQFLLSNTCSLLFKNIIYSWAEEMKSRSLVMDVLVSEYKITEYTQQSITELATAQHRITITPEYSSIRKILAGTRLEFDSIASIKAEATGVIKAGFALHESFLLDIDPTNQVISITLPRAKIVSNDVVPRILNEKNSFWNKITIEFRNQVTAALKQQLEQESRKQGILEEAEANADEIINILYSPITNFPGSQFRVEVQFEDEYKQDIDLIVE